MNKSSKSIKDNSVFYTDSDGEDYEARLAFITEDGNICICVDGEYKIVQLEEVE